MSKQVSEWINVEKQVVVPLPLLGPLQSLYVPTVTISTQSQSQQADAELSVGAGPARSAWWATELFPGTVASSMSHNLTGTTSSSGQAMLCWGSGAGGGRQPHSRCSDDGPVPRPLSGSWQVLRSRVLARGTHPSLCQVCACTWRQLCLTITKDVGEDLMGPGVPPWPRARQVTSLCFSSSPAKLWRAVILWLRTQHHIDGFCLLLIQDFSAPCCP